MEEENVPLLENVGDKTSESENWKINDKRQSKLTKLSIIISCATWGFLTGVERAIILPTLWLFLDTKFGSDKAQSYYGTCLAAFNLSVFIFAPIYGYLAYKGFRTKFLLIVSNQMEIVGNIIYFAASEPWMILFGRFLCGIGSGSEVPLYADVVRVTNSKERTFYIVLLLLARQVGLIIGPSATLIFHPVELMIGNIMLNIYNSPGFLMSILWSIQTLIVLILYPDVSKTGELIDNSQLNMKFEEKIISKVYRVNIDTNEADSLSNENSDDSLTIYDKIDGIILKCKLYSNYITLSLLFSVFASYFCLMSLESILPPVTVRHLKWSELENSWVYLIAGILVIVTFAALQKVSQYYKDRTIFVVGLVLLMLSYIWMCVTLYFINSQQHVLYTVLMSFALLLHIIGMSLVVACVESMFTKALPSKEMDLAQSVLRTVINLALLIGPFLAGMLQFYSYVVFLIMFILVSTSFSLVISQFELFDLS